VTGSAVRSSVGTCFSSKFLDIYLQIIGGERKKGEEEGRREGGGERK